MSEKHKAEESWKGKGESISYSTTKKMWAVRF